MRELDKKMATALGEKAEEYPALRNNNVYIERNFGKKSQFFNTIMMDGYVFNPYIHRRWLPVQYMDMIEEAGTDDIDRVIREKYNFKYMLDFVLHEIEKLCLLNRYDKRAYEERSRFFTLDCVKEIINVVLESVISEVEELPKVRSGLGYIFGTKVTYLDRDLHPDYCEIIENMDTGRKYCDWGNLLIHLTEVALKIKSADSYFEITRVLQNFPEIYNVFHRFNPALPDSVVEAFWKSGAYYSIKNKIMFQNGSVSGLKGSAACKELYSLLVNGMTAKDFHAIYMYME